MHYSAGAAQMGKLGEAYSKELVNSSNVGIVIEEIVAGHLIRVKESDPMKLYDTYLKFYDGTKETDFVYKKEDDKNIGIEVKYQNSVSLQDVNVPAGIDEYLLLTRSSDITRKNNCVLIPTCIFLAVLKSSANNL
jgi:predicted AAA+ superfamily ATPase